MSAGTAIQKVSDRLGGRQLGDLISIGSAMLRDFELLGIRSVAQLARQNPQRMYEKLGRVAGQHQDICVLDVFCAAVAQARNSRLPAEQCQWWYWSEKRKQGSNEVRISRNSREARKKNEKR
jgi:nucleotidyltransferase/DNA polymerase involved in DNA repair